MITWEIVNYIRDLYLGTNYTLEEISNITQEKFNIKIDYRTIHKIVKNQRWTNPEYKPKKTTYRKITDQVKKFILNNRSMTNIELSKEIKKQFNCEITPCRVGQLKDKQNNDMNLIIEVTNGCDFIP